ncbi:MAG: hypothetical protein ACEY3H_01795 [Wolbachia sp.]|nr:hypothetical protein [Wolbachia endosymbiont (group A) of Tiphia femorata]
MSGCHPSSLFLVIRVAPSPVIPVLLFCHPSPYDVIPVLDTGISFRNFIV